MPYELDGNCVKKKSGETIKCHDTHEEAVNHLQALQANVKDSAVVEMSLRITKASYNKSEDTPRRWMAIDSDIDEDLYQERMSLELYQDFDRRIQSNEPVPDAFRDVICEADWCGGMPYLSIAHFKAGSSLKNVPGKVESVYIDGTRLKSKGTLDDSPLGRKVFDSLVEDLYKKKSGDDDHLPVRISIGFLDLEHKHRSDAGGQEFTFVRNSVGEICPLCAQGIGGKIYTKGQLVHLAMTRVPVNPRTAMEVEKSMDEITSKRQDAESIIGDLANELEEKSIASDMLVVRSEEGSMPTPANMEFCDECYDPNTDSFNQECVDRVMEKYVGKPREEATVKSKALFDAVQKSLAKFNKSQVETPVVEASMDKAKEKEVKEDEVQEDKSLGIPEKKFEYAGVSGDGNNNIPNPVKADVEDEEEGEMEKAFSALKNRVAEAKSKGQSGEAVQDINQLFSQLGNAVEKEFQPKSAQGVGGLSANDIAEIVRSAVQPLYLEIQTLKSQVGKAVPASDNGVVKSRALTLSGYPRAEDMIQRAVPQQPQRKLTQIERLALKSTGAIRE